MERLLWEEEKVVLIPSGDSPLGCEKEVTFGVRETWAYVRCYRHKFSVILINLRPLSEPQFCHL